VETPRQVIHHMYSDLLDMGGDNSGCLVEPEEFKKRINEMPEKKLRQVLGSLDWLLEKTKRIWEIED